MTIAFTLEQYLGRNASPSPIRIILQWMRDRSRSGSLNALQSCGEQEIERIAQDCGLSAAEFRTLVRLGPNATDLLERRMEALGVDPIAASVAAPATFRDLQCVCSFCKTAGRCLRDLGRDPSDPAWKDYCPNAKTLTTLQAEGNRGGPNGGAP